jgi:hypothetical protein
MAESFRPAHRDPLSASEFSERIVDINFASDHVSQGTEMINDAGRQVFEERKQLSPHSDPRKSRVAVARILSEREVMPAKVCDHVDPPRPHKRSDQ